MKITAGDLDREVTFQTRTGTQNEGSGAYTYAWADIASVPTVSARVIEEIKSEWVADGIAMSQGPKTIIIRYRDDIDNTMRVVYEGQTLDIVTVPAEIGRRQWLRFQAVAHSTEGDSA